MRSPLVAAMLVAALVVTVQPALADTERGQSGQVGRHWLHDAKGSPGVRCIYVTRESPDGSFVQLKAVVVRPPVVYAAQQDAARTVMVGWRARLRGQNGKSWPTVAVRPTQKRTASTTNRAAFTKQRFDVGGTLFVDSSSFRVLVDMVWYSRDGQRVVGGAVNAADHYGAFDRSGNVVATEGAACQIGYN